MLDCADQVAFFESGQVVAIGTHRDLLRDVPAYRNVVTREEEVRA
jgi:ABC-type multidrug transport system fused ATPase/permease subunit